MNPLQYWLNSHLLSLSIFLTLLGEEYAAPQQCERQDCKPEAQILGVVILLLVRHIRIGLFAECFCLF